MPASASTRRMTTRRQALSEALPATMAESAAAGAHSEGTTIATELRTPSSHPSTSQQGVAPPAPAQLSGPQQPHFRDSRDSNSAPLQACSMQASRLQVSRQESVQFRRALLALLAFSALAWLCALASGAALYVEGPLPFPRGQVPLKWFDRIVRSAGAALPFLALALRAAVVHWEQRRASGAVSSGAVLSVRHASSNGGPAPPLGALKTAANAATGAKAAGGVSGQGRKRGRPAVWGRQQAQVSASLYSQLCACLGRSVRRAGLLQRRETLLLPCCVYAGLTALRVAVYALHYTGVLLAVSRALVGGGAEVLKHDILSDHVLLAACMAALLVCEVVMGLENLRSHAAGTRGYVLHLAVLGFTTVLWALTCAEVHITARFFHEPLEILWATIMGFALFQLPTGWWLAARYVEEDPLAPAAA